MKLIALGDTHGRMNWKDIVTKEQFDKVIFIGDYFDTHEDVSAQQQIDNFKDIISYKKDNMDKVVLLFGNHDFHYLRSVDEHYSGFQEWHKTDISEALHDALDNDLLQMCYVHDNFIFSHAGITKTWHVNVLGNEILKGKELELELNETFKYKPLSFCFTPGKYMNMYGDDVTQTPIWVRPNSLMRDQLDDYTQVVGHTTQRKLELADNVILIDTLGTSGEYLIITDGIPSISTKN